MKKLNSIITLVILSTTLLLNFNSLPAQNNWCPHQKKCAITTDNPSLQVVINKLKKHPESNRVIQEALDSGPIHVSLSREGMPFRAMWNSGMREIVIDGQSSHDQANILVDLLFELMNAVSEPDYQALFYSAQNGQIACDDYVETVERIEHNNMIKTVNILKSGVLAGTFPKHANMTVIYDFPIHYKIQQLTGHSLYIVKEYQEVSPRGNRSHFRGTVNNLRNMSEREKVRLAEYLYDDYFRTPKKA